VTTDVHQLDDGAWLSVNDRRRVNVGDLWLLAGDAVCECAVSDFLAEGFVEVGADGRAVEARVAGQCIACGRGGTTDWLELGRIDREGRFRAVEPTSVHLPRRTGPPADRDG
jgi:hypothetical protein